jgi:hypothetical protein
MLNMNFLKKIIFSSEDESATKLSAEERKVISDAKKLLKAIQQSSAETRLKAVKDLDKLCQKPENMEIFCLNEDLSLLSSFKRLLETIKDDDNCLFGIVSCFNRLSAGDVSCKVAIASEKLALFTVFMKLLKSSSDEKMIDVIVMTISNCSVFEGCHDYLLLSEIGWLDYLEKRLKEKPNDIYSYWWFDLFIGNMRNENILLLINRKIPEVIIQKMLCYGSDMKKWSADDGKVVGRIIIFVMNFSKSMNGSSYLMSFFNLHSQYNTFFFDLLPSTSMDSVRAVIIVANVYGREENNERTKALLSSHPDILPLLIDIMDAIMNWDVNRTEIKELIKKGFLYGSFKLSVVSVALKNLSISDENKSIMIKYPKLIRLACQGIGLFIDNAPECKGMNPGETWYCKGGGGGKDMLTVENLLELLLQLSFMFEDDIALKSVFITPDHDLQKMLEELLNIPIERHVSSETRQFALKLLSKLDPSKVQETGNSMSVGSQHIMLSYSWSANKDLVIAFGKKLQEMGYDVWRDEEGSSIMGPMSMTGNTLDAMTEAVEKSYMMIIFVSPEYKESTNCRTEGLYGFKRAANSGLKLLYVMMNENYTTESRPVAVNGWLAGMVGAELWYPLWNKTQLTSTVNAVASKLGNYCRLASNIPLSLQSPSSLKSPVSSLSPASTLSDFSVSEIFRGLSLLKVEKDADFISAFECLQKDKSLCPSSFDSLLASYNIMDSEDLKFADLQMIVTLSGLLKPRFRESFLTSLKL